MIVRQTKPKLSFRLMHLIAGILSRAYARCNMRLSANTAAIKSIKPPFLVLVNHQSFRDFIICESVLSSKNPNYVVSFNQFVKLRFPLRLIGGMPKRQFSADMQLIKNIRYVLDKKRPVVIFPEGRMSVDGTTNAIPPAAAKLVRLLGAPVVALKISGAYLSKPRWAHTSRPSPTRADVSLLFTSDEAGTLSIEEIGQKIKSALYVDDYEFQAQNNIVLKALRADGLHKILYKCPACLAEFKMRSGNGEIACAACGKIYELTPLGKIVCGKGAEYQTVHAWYEFQRAELRREIAAGNYTFSAPCTVTSINDRYKKKREGEGVLTHNAEVGFTLTFSGKTERFPPASMPAVSFDPERRFMLYSQTASYILDIKMPAAQGIIKTALACEIAHELAQNK